MFKNRFILVFLLLASIVFCKPSFAQNISDAAAEINGNFIPMQYFTNIFNRFLDDYKSMNPGMSIDKETTNWAKKYVMDEIVKRELILQEAKKSKITINEQEIEEKIKEDPFFKNKDGKFDKNKYLWARNDPKIDWSKIKASLYDEVLFQKFENYIMNKEKVSDTEVLNEYKKNNEKIKIKYVLFKNSLNPQIAVKEDQLRNYFNTNAKDFLVPEQAKIKYILLTPDKFEKEIVLDEAQIKAYYQANTEEFNFPERVKMRYIMFNLPQDQDTLAIQKKEEFASNVLKQLKGGMDFSEAAKKYSEDIVSGQKGGYAGYLKRGAVSKEIESIIFSLNPGQTSKLEKISSQLYIFKIEDKKNAGIADLEEAKEIISAKFSIEKAMSKAHEFALVLSKTKTISEFESKSMPYGGLVTTLYFSKDQSIETIGYIPEVNNHAFTLEIGQIDSQVITLTPYPGYYAYIVMAVSERKPPHAAKYEDVAEKVKELFINEEQKQLTQKNAELFRSKLSKPEDFDIQAKILQETPVEVILTRIQPYVSELGYVPDMIKNIFDSSTSNIGTYELPQGICLYSIIEKIPFDEKAFKREKGDLSKKILNQKNNESFSKWYETLKSRSSIKVYIEGYTN